MSVNKPQKFPRSHFFSFTKVSGFGLSSFDPSDLSSDDEEFLTPKSMVETTNKTSDRTAHLMTAASLHLNSPPEALSNWGQVNPNLNDYHSDPMGIGSTFWLLDIIDWWHQQEDTESKYADLSNLACNMFSIIPRGVGVEARFSCV